MSSDKVNILYIDDEPGNLTGFKASFSQQYKVWVSVNTVEAEKHLENNEIKVILVDYKMPEEDGIKFAMRIQEKFPFAIKILVTAYAESEIAIKAVNSHSFYGFIPKPWDYEQLNITIKNAIDKYDLEKQNRELVENLKQSLENEKRANKVKDVFLKNISHEVRTPLNSILGFSELIMTDPGYPELQSTLDIIVQSGKRLMHTMDNIIDSSVVFANKLKYKGETFCIRQMLNDVVRELYLDAIYSEKAEIIFNCNPDIPCKNDLLKTNVILNKLIDNAYKFSDSPKKIEISISEIESNDSYLIKIANNGDKIPKEESDLIFESFMNADNSLNRTHQGIGLGLHIAKAYTEFLGGEIWLEESEEQNIFCFTIKKDNTM